jgi:hypothetical protein
MHIIHMPTLQPWVRIPLRPVSSNRSLVWWQRSVMEPFKNSRTVTIWKPRTCRSTNAIKSQQAPSTATVSFLNVTTWKLRRGTELHVRLNSKALYAQLTDLRGSKTPLLNNTALYDYCRRTDFAKYSNDSLYSFVPF